MSKKLIFLIILLAFIVFILLLLSLSRQKEMQQTTPPSPTPVSIVPNNQNKKASDISLVIPGKTSVSDLKIIMGQPSSENQNGDLTQLNYPAELKNFNDEVIVKNNLVLYSIENVFDNITYGTNQDLLLKLGQPSNKLFNRDGFYYWNIFLTHGIGVETNGSEVSRIIRFIPQDKTTFMNNIGNSLGITESPTQPNEGINPAP